MEADKFKKIVLDKSDKDYGLCPPPIEAQEGLDVLIGHFLGESWYTTMPLSQQQVNTEAIYNILSLYPKRKLLKDVLKGSKRELIGYIVLLLALGIFTAGFILILKL
jgi:hypothetical protein